MDNLDASSAFQKCRHRPPDTASGWTLVCRVDIKLSVTDFFIHFGRADSIDMRLDGGFASKAELVKVDKIHARYVISDAASR